MKILEKYTGMKFMKREDAIRFLLVAIVLAGGFFYSCSTGKPDGEYMIEVYSQNDVHGRYFDSLYVGGKEHRSSMANVAGFIKERRRAIGEDQVVLIDAGDNLQGDNAAYYFNYVEVPASAADTTRHLFSRIVNYLKFDAVVVGNHDIETGHPVYDRIKRELKMPYLAANAVKTDGSGESYFQPYTVLDKNGIRIAVIGMTNPNIKKWLARSLWDGMDFLPIQNIADSVITAVIAKEKPHLVVLAIHAGLGDGTVGDNENPARYLAANLQNVDIILSSHDHLTANEKIWNGKDSVLLLEGGARGEMLSAAGIKLVMKNGRVVSKDISGRLINLAGTPKDSAYLALFREDFNKVKAFTNKKIGSLPRDVKTADAFFGPSDYMDIIHYAQLKETGADISFAAPLTSNGVVKAGDLNYQDLFTLYPFENQLYTVRLTGEQVKNYLEFSYDMWINTMKSKADHILKIAYNDKSGKYRFKGMSFNFDAGAGIDYLVDVTRPYGERITISGFSNGNQFSADSTYQVAISSYRANGGGELLVKGAGVPAGELESIVTGRYPEMRDVIYKNFSAGNYRQLPEYRNWKFVPETYSKEALKRDRALMF